MNNLRERFWNKVAVGTQEMCWIWLGSKNKDGYGTFNDGTASRLAHRAAYRLAVSDIPHGNYILHTCDNPACVNPAHLYAGTQSDNMRDRVARGRHSCAAGKKHWNARLTPEQVVEIRASYTGARGEQVRLSREYKIAASAISKIVSGVRWQHPLGKKR